MVSVGRLHLRDVLDQPDHPRVLSLVLRSVYTKWIAHPGDYSGGTLSDLPDRHLRGSDRSDAPSGRRLRVDEPRPWRGHRLRAGGDGVVVHTVALGAHLRGSPEQGGLRADGRDPEPGRG